MFPWQNLKLSFYFLPQGEDQNFKYIGLNLCTDSRSLEKSPLVHTYNFFCIIFQVLEVQKKEHICQKKFLKVYLCYIGSWLKSIKSTTTRKFPLIWGLFTKTGKNSNNCGAALLIISEVKPLASASATQNKYG